MILRATLGLAVFMAMLFGPAGSWSYWPAWLYLGVFFVPMLIGTLYFWRHDKQLLERRMERKEQRGEQRTIIGLFNLVFLAGFMLPGFDHRFGWSQLPAGVVVAASVIVLLGYLGTLWVMRTNSYAARTVRVEEGQELITTGPYAYVRHPMYTAVTAMMLATPWALGSWVAGPVFLLVVPLLMWRIRNEEQMLREELEGYLGYCEQVRWRLIPGLV